MNLKERYKRNEFVNFLQNQFLPDDFEIFEEQIDINFKPSYIVSNSTRLIGKVNSLDLNIYEFHHDSTFDPRVGLSRDMFRIMSSYGNRRALAVFVSSNSDIYRFSLGLIDLKADGSKIKKEYSNPRRFSFLLGPGAKTHTPEQFLIKKGRVSSFEDLQNRFSVEVVNKDFYERIAVKFTELVGGIRQIGRNNLNYQPLLKIPSQNDHTILQEFAVRLIGRLVFCWFLKMKVSDKGVPLIPESVLSLDATRKTKNFYHNILEPLFFEVLNTPISERKNEFRKNGFELIPFLNGGLFNPHKYDFYELNSLNKSKYLNNLIIPDEWLIDFIEILDTYNFTVDENTTVDIDLSVDPEMLGRIFENLLAEINPDTGETARKQTGSFYTPRPIVEYMVDESLIAYLEQKLSENLEQLSSNTNKSNQNPNSQSEISEPSEISSMLQNRLRKLLSYADEEHDFSEEEVKIIIDALDKLKILDPACGSGAFPIGMLHKIILILQRIDPKGELWLEKFLSGIKEPYIRKITKDKLSDKESLDYVRKSKIIRDSIYGVDIQEIAVEIAKLRCFLSIIVDDQINENQENRGIEHLPNLEFKFVAANTLIGLPKVEFGTQMFSFDEEINQLKALREEYFNSSGKDKKEAENKYIEVRDNLALRILKDNYVSKEARDLAIALANWNPFSNESSDWFEPEFMFGIKVGIEKGRSDGFDIVIGNPPYVQLQKDGGRLAELYSTQHFQTFARTGDIYTLFIEKGIQILKNDGLLCFITSNKWMRAGYGEKLREFLAAKTTPLKLIDFGGYKVFESATVDTDILITKKSPVETQHNVFVQHQNQKNISRRDAMHCVSTSLQNAHQFYACTVGDDFNSDISIADYFERYKQLMPRMNKSAWIISSDIESKIKEKIEAIGTPLKDWDINIYRGVLTGFNEAFIIDGKKKDELIAKDPKSAEIIKPILRGRNIKRYKAEFADEWLLFIPWHFPLHKENISGASLKAEEAFKKEYPFIYNHLLQFKEQLSKRNKEETGIRYEWYALQRCANTYYEEFEKEKIVWGNISVNSNFCLVEPRIFVNAPANLITSEKINLYFIISIMNSKIFDYEFRNLGIDLGAAFEWKKQYVEKIHIPKISPEKQKPFIELVEKIQKKKEKNEDTTTEEREIDRLVYELYGLTEEEIRIIERR